MLWRWWQHRRDDVNLLAMDAHVKHLQRPRWWRLHTIAIADIETALMQRAGDHVPLELAVRQGRQAVGAAIHERVHLTVNFTEQDGH